MHLVRRSVFICCSAPFTDAIARDEGCVMQAAYRKIVALDKRANSCYGADRLLEVLF